MRLMVLLAELGCPHSTSVLAVTVHVDMPCMSSSARALTSACSGHSERAHSSVDHRPFRSCGTRHASGPMRVTRPRLSLPSRRPVHLPSRFACLK